MHVVGTAGHVDHGKSTLVHALTGMDPDRFEEEKRRGLTIDLGFAWCTLPSGREIGIVDVPGHERFIRNMLAGAGGIDAALFVVAADEGWKPQSAEHLQILDFLGVTAGVVALTKTDLVSDVESAVKTIRERLEHSTLRQAPIVPVSAATGDGIEDLRHALDDLLATTDPAPDAERPRLFVDRSFTISGAGTVVTGTLEGGRLRVGDEIAVLPGAHRARIRSLQTHRSSVDEAVPGSRVAANLAGLDRHAVRRGDVVVRDEWILSDRFVARLRTARDLGHRLSERGAYEAFVGSAQTLCRLKFLDGRSEVGAGETLLVEVFADQGLPVVPGDRVVVRDVGRWETVAGAVVVDQAPPRLRRGDAEALGAIRAREGLTGSALGAHIIKSRGVVGRSELGALAGAGPSQIAEAVHAAGERVTPEQIVSSDRLRELASEAQATVASFHSEHPLAPGMPVDDLCELLHIDRSILNALSPSWDLTREGNVVRLPQHGTGLTAEQRAVADRALGTLRTAGASPPPLAEAGLETDLARAMERGGELVFVTTDIAYPADVWDDLQRRVAELIAASGPVTVSQVREAIGTSRKYAVPLLERFDAVGITRRAGDVRELGPLGRNLVGST